MRICILGIAGTFMSGIACLAKQLGHEVWGIDQAIYPPMSDVLKDAAITCYQNDDIDHVAQADLVIVGNAIKRGHPCLEWVLNNNIPYVSGAEWLFQNVLQQRKVIAITGTHGKTSCTHLLVHLMRSAGKHVGYLVAGQPKDNLPMVSLGDDSGEGYFVIEADEYDTAYFDKQPKFLKYRPHHVLINNIEFDHADIYSDIDAIYLQFSRLIRQLPSQGCLYIPTQDRKIRQLADEAYCAIKTFGNGGDLQYQSGHLYLSGSDIGRLNWSLKGDHMLSNALAVSTIALNCGIDADVLIRGLATFEGVKRRMHTMGYWDDTLYIDDFAHHPTAIEQTLKALKPDTGKQMVVVHATNYTQRNMLMEERFISALNCADHAIVLSEHWQCALPNITVVQSKDAAIEQWKQHQGIFSQCVTMSAKSMGWFYQHINQSTTERSEG